MANATVYAPLKTDRHIRLLQIVTGNGKDEAPSYRIVQKEILADSEQLDFEAASYTWGDPKRVSNLKVEGELGPTEIGLTRNLEEAMPHLSRHSVTGYLWIDQICIRQDDNEEKAKQVAMMSKIYKSASRVIIWLGPEDESSHICKQWLAEVDKMIKTQPNASKMLRDSPTFHADTRFLMVRGSFASKDTDPMYAPAIRAFFCRPWFARGWVVQEFLLARAEIFLTGDLQFSVPELADLYTVPRNGGPDEPENPNPRCPNILLEMKRHPFTDKQPLRFLRFMYNSSQEFITSELADTLYANLGLIEDSEFIPDYKTPIKENFTRFVVGLAEKFGSVDFLSLWSANFDEFLPSMPEQLKGFPSWVPSWYWFPLSTPCRLAVGGVRTARADIKWNAATDRKHVHCQQEDAEKTGRLFVRGRIIDSISALSTAKFDEYYDIKDGYLDELTNRIRKDLALQDTWTKREMIDFLNVASHNGHPATNSAEDVLGLTGKPFTGISEVTGYNEALSLCLVMGRGRRFVRTESGRLGLAPVLGSKPRIEEGKGSPIAIIHGCIVPMVLEEVDKELGHYKVVGDCYVKGIMYGESVVWDESEADTFVLV